MLKRNLDNLIVEVEHVIRTVHVKRQKSRRRDKIRINKYNQKLLNKNDKSKYTIHKKTIMGNIKAIISNDNLNTKADKSKATVTIKKTDYTKKNK